VEAYQTLQVWDHLILGPSVGMQVREFILTQFSKSYSIYDLHLGLTFKSNKKYGKQHLFEENVK
jgi:hypothetical protein